MFRQRSTFRWLAGLGLGGCLLLTGCGTTIATHSRGSQEEPIEAPSDGMYALYQEWNPSPIKEPMALHKGDRLGFKTAETGRIIVVAGDSEWTFEDAPLTWKRKD
jgi:hypothetical protein